MEQKPLRVGLIGYGAIGQDVVRFVREQEIKDLVFVGALVRDPMKVRFPGPVIVTSFPALLVEQPHVIVEVAGHTGLHEHGCNVLRAGIDLMLVSVGALAEPDALPAFREAAQEGKARIKVVSGAIGGLDALSAAHYGGFASVVHTLRKPPNALLSPEEATHLTTSREIFRGNVHEAVQRFPAFLNVAAAVALAAGSFERTEVLVVADPAVKYSLHEVQAEGVFGRLRFEIEQAPIGDFGYGARLVAMSIVHALLQRCAPVNIG